MAFAISDVLTKDGSWPGIQYPRIPGHEIAGVIDEVGAGVSGPKLGRRVGVRWHGGQDGTCISCRCGDFRNCRNLKIPGISHEGGYQQYTVAPVEALAAIPEILSDAEAAPLLCAGIGSYDSASQSLRQEMSAISRKLQTPRLSCCKTSSDGRGIPAVWCMASRVFRSVHRLN